MTDKIEKLKVSEIPDLRTDTRQDMVDSIPDPPKPKKINIFKKSWNWLNGKKFIIGLTLGTTGAVVSKVAVDPAIAGIGMIMQYVFWPLTAVGIGHKAVKNDNAFGPAGKFEVAGKTIPELVSMTWKRLTELAVIIKALCEACKVLFK